jgi:hypothetical protein
LTLKADIDAVDGVEEMDDAAATKVEELAATADSSTAADDKKPDDTLSLLRDVVKDKVDPAAPSASEEAAGSNPADGQTAKEADNENYSDVPFHKHPRFQEVLGDLKTAKVDAERYRNVQNYIEDQGLAAEEAAELLLIGGMMKRDPVGAWERVKPTIQKLLIAAGEVLPDDLKQRVEQGEMSREAAVELSRTRAQTESMRQGQTFDRQRAEVRQQNEHQTSLQTAATDWAKDRQLKDPNFDAKQPALMNNLKVLMYDEGKPKTAEGVRDQLKRAYDAVAIPAAAPVVPKRAVTPIRGGQVAGSPQTAPQSTLDIIRAQRMSA